MALDIQDTPSTFEIVSQKLAEIGALSLSDFVHDRKPLLHAAEEHAISHPAGSASVGAVTVGRSPSPVRKIEDVCQDAKVKLEWFFYSDKNSSSDKSGYGAALLVRVNNSCMRAYSTAPCYPDRAVAQKECASLGVSDGILEWVHEIGSDPATSLLQPDDAIQGTSVQEFFDSLPRLFPDGVTARSAHEANAINRVDKLMKRHGVIAHFYPLRGQKSLHGSVLRLECTPSDHKSYIVPPVFPNRGDAKTAVYLLAMSQGVVDYIRKLGHTGAKLSVNVYTKGAHVMEQLEVECSNLSPSNKPIYTVSKTGEAFSAELQINLSTTDIPDIQKFSVAAEYRSADDARRAVALHAAESGILELLCGVVDRPGTVQRASLKRRLTDVADAKTGDAVETDAAENQPAPRKKRKRKHSKTVRRARQRQEENLEEGEISS
ncbi:hypothetical protein FISHEDRAFT_72182 [Fistulina hepatica ATCC 64428]|uniref:Uncharacterized protein n=1 Tax=Fistulina hepatica ATCC 64428 TaxID=1128425 RepID=A0A0D7AFR1_9AGAR|nr:hypothetical protein FISHEDRAFT_72182 [Fistulina hepatica ATCC 64428]